MTAAQNGSVFEEVVAEKVLRKRENLSSCRTKTGKTANDKSLLWRSRSHVSNPKRKREQQWKTHSHIFLQERKANKTISFFGFLVREKREKLRLKQVLLPPFSESPAIRGMGPTDAFSEWDLLTHISDLTCSSLSLSLFLSLSLLYLFFFVFVRGTLLCICLCHTWPQVDLFRIKWVTIFLYVISELSIPQDIRSSISHLIGRSIIKV